MAFLLRAALALVILAWAPFLLEQFESPKAGVVRVIGGALLAGILATWIARSRRTGTPVKERSARGRGAAVEAATASAWTPLDTAMLAWLMVEIVATLHAVAPAIGFFGEIEQHEGLLTSLGLAGCYAAARAAPGARAARDTLVVALAALALSCAIGLWQLATFSPAQWQTASAYGEWHRPFGTLGHPNLLGALAAAGLAAALGLAASGRRGRAGWIALAAWLGLTVLLTVSRAAWLAALAGAAVALATAALVRTSAPAAERGGPARSGRAAWIAASLGGVVLIAAFALAPIRTRALELLAFGSGSGRSRLEIWKTAVAMWRANPWLGNGPDTFRLLFDRYQTPDYWRIEWGAAAFHAHSIYLQIFATRGLLGIAAALAVAATTLMALTAAARADGAARALVPAFSGLLVGLAVAGLGGAIGIAGATLVAVTLGALPGLAPHEAPAPRRAVARPWPRIAVVAGGLGGLMMLLATLAQERSSHAAYLSQLSDTEGWRLVSDARRAATIAPWSDVMAANAADVLRRQARFAPHPPAVYAEAESLALRAIALAPQRLYDWSELMLVQLASAQAGAEGADREAAATAERCAEVGPYDILPQVRFAEASLATQRSDLALPAARRAAAVYPEEALPHALVGYAQLAERDSMAALASFRRALTLTWRLEPARKQHVEDLAHALAHQPLQWRLGRGTR